MPIIYQVVKRKFHFHLYFLCFHHIYGKNIVKNATIDEVYILYNCLVGKFDNALIHAEQMTRGSNAEEFRYMQNYEKTMIYGFMADFEKLARYADMAGACARYKYQFENLDRLLGRYGVHSLSKKDIAYHAQDVDNGGPGACPSFAPAIVNRLYRDGRTMEGDKIFMRLKWLADCFPYWSDSQYADRMDYRHNTPLQLNIEGGCLAQTIVFGLFGVEVGVDMKPVFRPHLPKGVSRMSLRGLRLCGSSYDVAVDGSGTVVKSRGKAVRK